MTHTPHELAEEFPQSAELIHKLKLTNPHFAQLVDEYHEINRKVHRSETNIEPTDPAHEAELRKRRVALKDAVARMLSA